jgi:hypothetical protein
MSENLKTFVDLTRNKVIDMIVAAAAHQDINYDTTKAIDYISETFRPWLKEMLEELRSDAKQSDFGNGIERGVVHALPKHVASISWSHACVKYAEQILEHSKT